MREGEREGEAGKAALRAYYTPTYKKGKKCNSVSVDRCGSKKKASLPGAI